MSINAALRTSTLELRAIAQTPRPRKRVYAGYYMLLVLLTTIGVLYGWYFSDLVFPDPVSPPWLLVAIKLFWLVPAPYALLNFYSFLRYPVFVRAEPLPVTFGPRGKLIFRYVSRGHNPHLVAEVVAEAYATLQAEMPPDSWRVEVVVDVPQPLTEDEYLRVIVVPPDYATENDARYKARALHYALSASDATPEDWIIHLDEETRFTADTVRAIAAFVRREERAMLKSSDYMPRIGQGIIRYNRSGIVNLLTALADSIRIGDDYGRFRLQFEHGAAWFGMHGSFVVVQNRLEAAIGFDHGPAGNITEDAYFALIARHIGVRFAFIHAFMDEQSPYSLKDFAAQRRRWFGGLWLCVLSPYIAARDRLILGSFMAMWTVAPLCIGLVYLNIFIPTGTPVWLAVAGGVSFMYYVALYIIGFISNFDRRMGWGRYFWLLLLQILLIPIFSVMEASGVIYGLIKPPKDFYIVQKERQVA